MPPPRTRSPRARATPRKRARRDPEAARAMILAAAEQIFAERSPDVVGLKDVARAAGVSHALVSHYFGTYDALVEAALERRMLVVRDAIARELLDEGADHRPAVLLKKLWSAAADPVSLRLGAWALLSGRLQRADFFAGRVQGLRLIADALEKNLLARGRRPIPRDDIEFILMASMATTYGYAISGNALFASLGRASTRASEEDFRERMAEMVELYLSRKR